jgi:hypothetical protein
MNREVHVRFWEGLGVRFPRATQLLEAEATAPCCLIDFLAGGELLNLCA